VRTTELRYEGGRVVGETETHDGVTITRTFTLDETGAIVTITRTTTGGPTTHDGTYLVTYNGHGDALTLERIEADGTLTVANRFAYGTWGIPTVTAHNGHPDHRLRYRYVGRFGVADDTTGLVATGLLYLHARHYSPELGRFLQPDPARAETNMYAYAANSPTTKIDPEGTNPICATASLVLLPSPPTWATGLLGGLACGVTTVAGVLFVSGVAVSVQGDTVRSAASSNVQANKAWGDAWAATVVAALRRAGWYVHPRVYFAVPGFRGGRLFDACVYHSVYTFIRSPNGNAVMCIEAKTGASRNPTQEAKDRVIRKMYPRLIIIRVYGPGRTGRF
jgi:RHS repeat-associated protein